MHSGMRTLPFLLLSACVIDLRDQTPRDTGGLVCTEIGCTDGFEIAFTATDPGLWIFDLSLDGDDVRCTATLPFRDGAESGCDDDRVTLFLSGTALDDAEHAIAGLLISTTPETVELTIRHDDTDRGHTFTPEYEEVQPNGEGCPPVCHQDGADLGEL